VSLTRRYFLKSAAAAAAIAAKTEFLQDAVQAQGASASEKLGVAVIGAGGRGGDHLSGFAGRDDSEVLYICDVDQKQAAKVAGVEAKQGRAPQFVTDFRRILDDPRVDCISTATPNHWHALISILAMQAGKDVYVEKPVSHNVWEGRQAVSWARKLGKICQCGTQSRSSPSLKEAVAYVQSGALGKIQYAVGTCYKPRKSIGKLDKPLVIPPGIDYDMWCGPAAKVDLYRPNLHYDWHWDFNTGNGDMGNQGIHQMDIARWFLGEMELSPKFMSIGGRLGYDDAGDTPNTQVVYHAYEKAPLIFETRGLPKAGLNWSNGMDEYRGSQVGVIIQCEQGYVVVPSYTGCTAFDNDGNVLKSWKGGGDHYGNFLSAVRTRKHEDLNADILDGHLSSALCHTGNLSHQVGEKRSGADALAAAKGDPLLADSFERMVQHLAANGVKIDEPTVTVGPWIEMNPALEVITNHEKANSMLTRNYRPGYVVPAAS
jgi:predicted dehydrogenase